MVNPYDRLYRQMDFYTLPFGYPMDYYVWRTSKLKGEISKYIKKKGSVLDVGGGTGIMAEFLPEFVDKDEYVNLDISKEMLKYCEYRTICSPAEDIPLPDNSFDYVTSSEVLEHVNDKTKMLEECYRVLKPGGKLILTTPRTGWRRDYLLSPWLLFYVIHLIFHVMELIFNPNKWKVEEGVIDLPSDELWLRRELKEIGFTITTQYRLDNHPPWKSTSKFWQRFSDRFLNPRKFGLCTLVVCVKEERK